LRSNRLFTDKSNIARGPVPKSGFFILSYRKSDPGGS
jgi:hypothetical protein